MPLVLSILTFSIVLGLTVKRVGVAVYASMFGFALVATLVFFGLYGLGS